MDKIQLQILGISSGHTSTSYTLILEELNGPRKLPIIIGAFEAQAIAIEIEKIVPVRPMTHDLIKSFASAFDISIKEILIHRLSEGVFYASIICTDGKEEKEIDARTSDAIALALRFKSPIYTYEAIMAEAGIILSEVEGEPKAASETLSTETAVKPRKASEDLNTYSLEELDKMLDEALEVENYIMAAKIRDEIKKRSEDK
jgi:bifunctional DNase/RNase